MAKKSNASRQADWSRKLKRRFTLKDGTNVVTLEDAAGAIQDWFKGVTPKDPVQATIARLIRAAETGKRADVEAATESVMRSLSARAVLESHT